MFINIFFPSLPSSVEKTGNDGSHVNTSLFSPSYSVVVVNVILSQEFVHEWGGEIFMYLKLCFRKVSSENSL